MAQQKKHPQHINRMIHLRTKWRIFFALLLAADLLFILQIFHAMYIYPATMSGSLSVAFVGLYGWYIILLLAIIHIIAIGVYLMIRRPQDYRLVVSTIVAIVSLFLLYQFDLVGVVKGISEKMTIPNESTIAKKTALRLLQECRINDLVITQLYGAKVTFMTQEPDWPATVLTGQTLAYFSISIFAQALITLVLRAFYAQHDTKTPLIVGAFSTAILILTSYIFILVLGWGVESLGIAFSISSILQLITLFLILEKKVGGFNKGPLFTSWAKFFISSFLTAFALYIPIKLLDQLVFDTTRTINLIILTGISSLLGLSLYLFLTWFFDVKEARAYVLMFKKIGNWKEILKKSQELLGMGRMNS